MTRVHSLYEYLTIEEDITETLENLKGNFLDFSIEFENMRWAEGELKKIAHELVDASKYFGEQQELNPSGNLLTATKAEPRGNTIYFWNDAVNDRNQFYAGHIEYGHYARDGKTFVPARPFMRPALYAVSRASQGNMRDILSELLMMPFKNNGRGYKGLNNLEFGHKLGKYYGGPAQSVRVGLLSSAIGQQGFSMQEGFIKKTGFNMSPRRGRNNALNRALMSDAGWDSRGRSTYRGWYSQLGQGTNVRVKHNLSYGTTQAINRRGGTRRNISNTSRVKIIKNKTRETFLTKTDKGKKEGKKHSSPKKQKGIGKKGQSKVTETHFVNIINRKGSGWTVNHNQPVSAKQYKQMQKTHDYVVYNSNTKGYVKKGTHDFRLTSRNQKKVGKIPNRDNIYSDEEHAKHRKEILFKERGAGSNQYRKVRVATSREMAEIELAREHDLTEQQIKNDYSVAPNGILYPKRQKSSVRSNAGYEKGFYG